MIEQTPSTTDHRSPGVVALLATFARLVRQRPVAQVAFALLAIDVAFAVIQVAVELTDYGFNGAYRLSLETEFGLAQIYGFAQVGTAAALLGIAWRRFGSPHALLWSAVFVAIAVDDAWSVHERLGTRFAEVLGLGDAGGVRGQDFGELLAFFLLGVIALGALITVERRTGPPTPSPITKLMLPLAGLLVFFAVVVDAASNALLPDVIGIPIEDGGELVVMTLILLASWTWVERADEYLGSR